MDSVRIFSAPWTREELVQRLKAGLKALRGEVPLVRAYLFGSWAKGRALPTSDIDLLLVYRGPRRKDLPRLAWRAFPGLPLELHAHTEEARALEKVLKAMLEGALPLLE